MSLFKGISTCGLTSETVVSLRDVCFSYNQTEVLSNINLTVNQGEFLAVIGPNGGGKTTLVKIILGLFSPSKGEVLVMGNNPIKHRPGVGYVPQHAAVQLSFPITVCDVVLMGLKRTGLRLPGYKDKDHSKALDALETVNMTPYALRRFDRLSGGQKQRVLIARAMIADPCLLVFDEPTSNIDPQGKLCLFEVLSALSKSVTIILVSHDLISASAQVSSVAVVNKTLIQSQGTELSPEMMQLIYGTHDSSCPLGGYIQEVSDIFERSRDNSRKSHA